MFIKRTYVVACITATYVFTLLALGFAFQNVSAACTFTVTNTNDSGSGSLRQAISSANSNGSSLDTVCFAIPGGAYKTISANSMFTVTQPIILDGTTQPGYSGRPVIEINGLNAGPSASGINITAGGSTIKGLIVNRFAGDGIILNNNGGNTIQGNYVGTNSAGTAAMGNGASGIGAQTPNNIIGGVTAAERNVVSGNHGTGIALTGSNASNNTISGNYVGTDYTGLSAVPNSADGILLTNAPNNTVGGTTGVTPDGACTGSCNLTSGNGANGIGIWQGSASGNTVLGNFAGVDVTGLRALPNADIGFEAQDAAHNTIGGTTPAERNVFSGNFGAGVSLTGSGATNNVVSGNYIGTDTTGQRGIGNHKMGVNIGSPSGGTNNAHNNLIGGSTGVSLGGSCTGSCNVISSNGWNGVYISGSTGGSNQIKGNFIGMSASGGLTMGNVLDGVGIIDSPSNLIGGVLAAERNLIAGNGANGVVVIGNSAGGNVIQGNYIGEATNQGTMPNQGSGISIAGGVSTAIVGNNIYGSGYLGIDIGINGVSQNDNGDGDGGPNGTQNYPILSYAIPVGANEKIGGSFNSLANTQFLIEFFQSPSCDASQRGEGRDYVGSAFVTTDGAGNATIRATVPIVPGGRSITATANRMIGSVPVEGSEFSNCVFTPRQHPDGAIIRPSGSGNIFMMIDGVTSQIGSIGVLNSWNIAATDIKTATSADSNTQDSAGQYFREGTLLKGSSPDIYVIDKTGPSTYVKRKITNGAAFNNLGYTIADVLQVPDSNLSAPDGPDITNADQHPDGAIVKSANGTLYLIELGQKRLIGSPAVFISQRYKTSQIKNATAADLALTTSTNVYFREGSLVKGTGPTIYVIDDGGTGMFLKRAIVSPTSFLELGYTITEVLQVPNDVLPLSDGASI